MCSICVRRRTGPQRRIALRLSFGPLGRDDPDSEPWDWIGDGSPAGAASGGVLTFDSIMKSSARGAVRGRHCRLSQRRLKAAVMARIRSSSAAEPNQTGYGSRGPFGDVSGVAAIGVAPGAVSTGASAARAPPASLSIPSADRPGSKTGEAPFGRLRQFRSLVCNRLVIRR